MASDQSLLERPVSCAFTGYQSGESRFKSRERRQRPKLKEWRCNLTGFSKVHDLYLVACNEEIHVHRPEFPTQFLADEPELIIKPPATKPRRGYIDVENPHSITRLQIDFLGNEEVLLVACDDGDVIGYKTERFQYALDQLALDGDKANSKPKPFFHQNFKMSAWGLAVHREARLIAVSANSKKVTVIAFALASPEEVSIPLESIADPPLVTRYSTHLLDDRSSPQMIELTTGTNTPSVSFDNSGRDPLGQWLLGNTIDGVVFLWDLCRSVSPIKKLRLSFCAAIGQPDLGFPQCSCDNAGHYPHGMWSAIFIDPRSCLGCSTITEALGPRAKRSRDYFWDLAPRLSPNEQYESEEDDEMEGEGAEEQDADDGWSNPSNAPLQHAPQTSSFGQQTAAEGSLTGDVEQSETESDGFLELGTPMSDASSDTHQLGFQLDGEGGDQELDTFPGDLTGFIPSEGLGAFLGAYNAEQPGTHFAQPGGGAVGSIQELGIPTDGTQHTGGLIGNASQPMAHSGGNQHPGALAGGVPGPGTFAGNTIVEGGLIVDLYTGSPLGNAHLDLPMDQTDGLYHGGSQSGNTLSSSVIQPGPATQPTTPHHPVWPGPTPPGFPSINAYPGVGHNNLTGTLPTGTQIGGPQLPATTQSATTPGTAIHPIPPGTTIHPFPAALGPWPNIPMGPHLQPGAATNQPGGTPAVMPWLHPAALAIIQGGTDPQALQPGQPGQTPQTMPPEPSVGFDFLESESDEDEEEFSEDEEVDVYIPQPLPAALTRPLRPVFMRGPNIPNPQPLPDCPIMMISKQDVFLAQPMKPKNHNEGFPFVVMHDPPNSLPAILAAQHGSYDRQSFTIQIPELGVVLVGTSTGKVSIMTLTALTKPSSESSAKASAKSSAKASAKASTKASAKSAASSSAPRTSSSNPTRGVDELPEFGFRHDCRTDTLPFPDELENYKYRNLGNAGRRLVGLAASPLPGNMDMPNTEEFLGPHANVRRWRLVLHYQDHTILSYVLSRPWKDTRLYP